MAVFENGLGKRSEHILRALQAEIQQGAYPAGGLLPTEQGLCTRFEASRNTVRRAVARLAADGWVEVRQGAGTFVRTPPSAPPGARTLAAMIPFESGSLRELQGYVLDQGYLLCVHMQNDAAWDPQRERFFLQRVLEEGHRALLAFCTPREPFNDDVLAQMDQRRQRVIHIEPYRMTQPAQGFVFPDYRKAGHMAAVRLLLAGYEQIVFVGAEEDWPAARMVQEGLAEALREHAHGYRPDQNYFDYPLGAVAENIADNPAGKALRKYLRGLKRTTGLVCRSNDIANELVRALTELGKDVPGEFGVIGVSYLAEPAGRVQVADTLDFDRRAGLKRAIDAAAAAEWKAPREWLAPKLVAHGTVRAKG